MTQANSATGAVRQSNAWCLDAEIVERQPIRYTPAGIAVIEFCLRHASYQVEGHTERGVAFETDAVAIDAASQLIVAAPLGVMFRFSGFMALKSKKSKTLVFHVTKIDGLNTAH